MKASFAGRDKVQGTTRWYVIDHSKTSRQEKGSDVRHGDRRSPGLNLI